MHGLKQSQQVGVWVRSGGMPLIAAGGKVFSGLVAVMNAIAVFYEEQEAHERSLSFEECLQRTGRIRYRIG